jgi:hypothetical protein
MIYTTTREGEEGLTLDHEDRGAEVDAALEKIQQGILELDEHYYSVAGSQLRRARAMASRLMMMLEDE